MQHENIDVALRFGALPVSDAVARRLALNQILGSPAHSLLVGVMHAEGPGVIR
jgi:hypothetical protein